MTPIQALRALLGALPPGTGGTDAPDLPKALRDAQEALDAYDKGHGPVKAPEGPQPGETWQHFKGGLYRIITVAVDEKAGSPLVVYTSPTGVWTRSLLEFIGPVDKDGYKGPRFVKVEGAATMPDPGAMLRALIEVVNRDTTVVMGTPMDADEAFRAVQEVGKTAREALGINPDGSEDCDENGDGPPPKLRPLLEGTPTDETTKSRSFEAAVRDTITWGVDGPAEAERLNALLERDFTLDERNSLIRVLCGLTGISVKPGDPCITQLVDGWKVGVQGGNMSAIDGDLSGAMERAGFASDAEVIRKLVESR